MISLWLVLSCATAPPPPTLPAPWAPVAGAVLEGTVASASDTSLVLHHPKSASPGDTGSRYAEALELAGWTVGQPMKAGPALLWECEKGERKVVLAAVTKKDRLEIHLDE